MVVTSRQMPQENSGLMEGHDLLCFGWLMDAPRKFGVEEKAAVLCSVWRGTCLTKLKHSCGERETVIHAYTHPP